MNTKKFLLTGVCILFIVSAYAQQSLQFLIPASGSIRRGQETTVLWYGGEASVEKQLFLYQGDKPVAFFGKLKDVWLFNWKVSRKLPKGDDYNFRLITEKETVVSGRFTIKPAIPLLVKLSPLILAAAIIPFLNHSTSSTESDGPLPGAPDPE